MVIMTVLPGQACLELLAALHLQALATLHMNMCKPLPSLHFWLKASQAAHRLKKSSPTHPEMGEVVHTLPPEEMGERLEEARHLAPPPAAAGQVVPTTEEAIPGTPVPRTPEQGEPKVPLQP